MKVRYLLYVISGLVFGVFDYYWQIITSEISEKSLLMWAVFAWGIFFIVAIPIAVIEYKISKSKIRSGISVAMAWGFSIVAYYFYMMFSLVFIGQETQADFYISHMNEPYYWDNLSKYFSGSVVQGMLEWIGIALIGGFIVGIVAGLIVSHFEKFKQNNKAIKGLRDNDKKQQAMMDD